jgi:hypothetical protein
VLRYLWGTFGFGLRYVGGDEVRFHGCSDSYWKDIVVDRKNTYGGRFILGSTMVSWYNRKQTFVALDSTEAEYMLTSLASCEAIICLHKLLAILLVRS